MSTRWRLITVSFLLSGLCAGCDGDDFDAQRFFPSNPAATHTPSATPTPAAAPVTALFSVDPRDAANPFPSDRTLDETGTVNISAAPLQAIVPDEPRYAAARAYQERAVQELNTLAGFSTFAPIRVVLDGPVVIPNADIPEGIFVLRQDDPQVRVAVRAEAVTPEIAGDFAVEIRPMVPLEAETRYVYAVTSSVRDLTGQPIAPDPTFSDILCGDGVDESLATWRQSLEEALQELQTTNGVECEEIAVMDVFVTQPIADDLISIRELFDSGTLPFADPVLDESPVQGLTVGVFEEGTPEFEELVGTPTSDALRAVAVGTFPSFDFRGPSRVFTEEFLSGESVPRVSQLPFYVALPKAPPPPGGYPLVIYGHGLSRSGADAITTAASVSDRPMIWAGVSAVSHGRRGNFLNFFNLSRVLATRENFRQTIADFLQLQRMIRHTDDELFAEVNRNRVHYYGVSLGGIMGSLYMGVESDVEVAMLSVPGGGLPNILVGSDIIGDLINPLISVSFGVPVDDPFFPVILYRFAQFAQWSLDPGDPVNMAPFLLGPGTLPGVPPKRILVHEGITDTIVPNATTEDLVAAMRLPDVKAPVGCADPAGCSGIWRFVMTDYDQPFDCGHLVGFAVEEAHRQSINYLFTDGTEIEDASPRLPADERSGCTDLSDPFPD
jgi:hypothetical protein